MSAKRGGHSFFPKEEDRSISLLEAVAYASSDELVALEAKIDRLVARTSGARPNVATGRKLAALVMARRTTAVYYPDKRRRIAVAAQWACLPHRVVFRRKIQTTNLVALVVEVEGRSVLGLARSKVLSKLPDEIFGTVWKNELSLIYTNEIASKLYAWARRAHNDRIAAPTPALRAWAELVLFKWKPTPPEAVRAEVV